MSTPGGYGQQGPQYQQAPGPDGTGAKRPNMAVYWAVTIVAVLGLSVAGYFFGRSQGEKQYDPGTAGYQKIYQAGYAQGRSGGEASGAAKGKQEGLAAGTKAGLEKGQSQGQAQGTQEGAAAALGGFTQWDNGTFYVVTTAAGQQAEVPTVISSRVPMASNTYYSPCESDPTTLCTFPRPPAGSSGSGSGSGGANADGGN